MWKWIAAAWAGLWICLRSAYERRIFTTEEYELWSEKIKKDRTLVFLSDLHDNRFGPGQRRLLAGIARVRPDAVLIGGDMMVVKKRADIGAALFLVKKLAKRYPVYYGNGNHENRMDRDRGRYGDRYDVLVRELRKAGVFHLSDDSAELGEDIRISGVDLKEKYYEKFFPAALTPDYIEERLGCADAERYQILLAHTPSFQSAYARWGADLTLAGHFHGGTVWLPGLGGLMTPQFVPFQKNCAGLHGKHGKYMIVSRGLGTHSVNLRLNNPSELVVVKLHPAKDRIREWPSFGRRAENSGEDPARQALRSAAAACDTGKAQREGRVTDEHFL